MKSKKSVFSILLIVFVVGFIGLLANYVLAEPMDLPSAPQALTGTAFTYQGRLTDGGGNGRHRFPAQCPGSS